MRHLVVLAAALVAQPAALQAQGYLLRLDARMQSVSYRGVKLDSIPDSAVDTASNGSLYTPDGYSAYCPASQTQCEFYRAGPTIHSAPLMTSADLTVWGIGLPGLSLHANARAGGDLASAGSWPGTEPAVQLLEGYAKYQRQGFTGRLGRVVHTGRLGYTGFDGAALRYRTDQGTLSGEGYIGVGLARGSLLPVTSPEMNPFDEFQPEERQLVTGLTGGWNFRYGELRAEYQREVDRDTRNFVSERAAVEARVTPFNGLRLEAGTEYDIARGLWGSSEADILYDRSRYGASGGVRRYRPYFDLWSLWGVFSPVGYDAIRGRVWARPIPALELRASGETFNYEETHATTGLTDVEDSGWRWAAGLGFRFAQVWNTSWNYHAEYGAGAASSGWDGSVGWAPMPSLDLTADGGHLDRPLEYRYSESDLLWFGLHANLRATDRLRLGLGGTWYDETRDRPDASGVEWDQIRVVASVSYLFGSGADRLPLPPAVRRRGSR
ncbi:MAG: hypothetical protein OEW80_08965 [Gemmatimonadota bacterium]|nr:hypothetical protein [Gemmatimonadota bacterium]